MKTIAFKMTFHSIADRDEWMRSEGINPVAFAACGAPIRFVGERHTLQAPINNLCLVHGEMALKNPA